MHTSHLLTEAACSPYQSITTQANPSQPNAQDTTHTHTPHTHICLEFLDLRQNTSPIGGMALQYVQYRRLIPSGASLARNPGVSQV